MLKKFNKLIFESFEETSLNNEIHFSRDTDNNIIANFFSIKDNKKIYFIILKINDKLKIYLTNEDGGSETLTEKTFSLKYNNEYNNYKKELKKFENFETINNKENINSNNTDQIINFNNQIKNIKNKTFTQDIKVDNINFNFTMLEDDNTVNYCKCFFTFFDKKEIKNVNVKILLYIREHNSIIIKMVVIKNDEELTLADYKFKELYQNEYLKFKEALSNFEKILNLKN